MSGAVYVSIMWIGTSYSKLSFNLLFTIILIISLFEMYKLRKGKSKLVAFSYVLLPLLFIQFIGLKDKNFDSNFVLLMFILTWTFDTFAYLFGITFGKHKILPQISAKKTWEGFVGGSIFTIITTYITRDLFILIDIKQLLIISLFLPFTATIGDSIESFYKRQAGVKDSGDFIPGHGGILDRIDSFLITIPVLYILLSIKIF
ncbi:uncharacterized protein METZ01_LOCUS287123 [marine metagenome]|uniref:Phosphatidate cytidylyltransferase n=1 Tax=marine metagenome TaxID=408172 RepID=A0A382LCA2_9ZZZZ